MNQLYYIIFIVLYCIVLFLLYCFVSYIYSQRSCCCDWNCIKLGVFLCVPQLMNVTIKLLHLIG